MTSVQLEGTFSDAQVSLIRDELDFEAIRIFQISRVVLRPAGERVLVREHQLPAMQERLCSQFINQVPADYVECQVIKARTTPVMPARCPGRGLLNDDIGVSGLPAPTARPVLEHPVAQRGEHPSPARDGLVQIGHPQLDVMDGSGSRWLPRRRPA